jgi:hypothetical protein
VNVAEVISALDYFNFAAGMSPAPFALAFNYSFDLDTTGTVGSGSTLRLTTETADITGSAGITVASGATVRLGKKATYAVPFIFQNGSTVEVFPNADRGGADLDLTHCTFAATTTINVTSGTATVLVPAGSAANISAGAGVTIPAPSATLTISGIVDQSRLLIRKVSDNSVLVNALVTGTSYAYTYQVLADVPVSVVLRKASGAPFYTEWSALVTLTANDNTITANQTLDT